jgi:hypothetical protein
MSATHFTIGVLKIRVRVVPLPLGVCGMPPSVSMVEGSARGAASIVRLAGIERDSSSVREIERAQATERNPKMSPTGLDRSTRLKVNGVFVRFLGSAVGARSGSSSNDRASPLKRSRSTLREGERCRRGVVASRGEEAESWESLGEFHELVCWARGHKACCYGRKQKVREGSNVYVFDRYVKCKEQEARYICR